MKISNKSLHYKFNAFVQQDRFTDKVRCNRLTTCSYIRTTIYSALMAMWFALLAVICVVIVVLVVGSAIWVPIAIFFMGGTPTGLPLALASMVWIAIAITLLILTWKYIKLRYIIPVYREPNVFIQAIKDQHNKFCTRVEVV